MKVLIIYSGNYGSTKKASELLADYFDEVAIVDTSRKPIIDYSKYDVLVFGTNIRFSKPNSRFIKYAKKYKKALVNCKVYAFVTGIDVEWSDRYQKDVSEKLNDCYSLYVGGELNNEEAKGFDRICMEKMRKSYNVNGYPMPTLYKDKIASLSKKIINENE